MGADLYQFSDIPQAELVCVRDTVMHEDHSKRLAQLRTGVEDWSREAGK